MIKVIHEMQELDRTGWNTYRRTEDLITLERFVKSFVEEEWSTEQRYGSMETPYEIYHNKTIVDNPYANKRSVRHFEYVG